MFLSRGLLLSVAILVSFALLLGVWAPGSAEAESLPDESAARGSPQCNERDFGEYAVSKSGAPGS